MRKYHIYLAIHCIDILCSTRFGKYLRQVRSTSTVSRQFYGCQLEYVILAYVFLYSYWAHYIQKEASPMI